MKRMKKVDNVIRVIRAVGHAKRTIANWSPELVNKMGGSENVFKFAWKKRSLDTIKITCKKSK
jgi:hypothetical protein